MGIGPQMFTIIFDHTNYHWTNDINQPLFKMKDGLIKQLGIRDFAFVDQTINKKPLIVIISHY